MTVRHASEVHIDREAPRRVVVGVHESAPSVAALIWALRVATERGWEVQVVTAWPDADVPWIHEVPGHYCEARAHAETAQQAAMFAALRAVPGAPMPSVSVTNEPPAEALVTASRCASLLVVGEPEHLDAHRRVSLGRAVARRVRCPVVVVPREGLALPRLDDPGREE